jgi:hypothetical protein
LGELERTGDLERLTEEYPHFVEQLHGFWHTRRLLEGAAPKLDEQKLLARKQEFLTAIAAARPKRTFGMLPIRLAGLFGIGGVLVAASLGASAAGLGPAQRAGEFLANTVVNHGSYVSDAVQGARDSTSPGPERGEAVSNAACEAAHDRSTLPESAQDAPGQEDKDPKDCSKTDNDPGPANEAAAGEESQSSERGMAACAAAAENRGSHGQGGGNASSQALERSEPGCDGGNTEASEPGQGSGGKPADLPAAERP